MHHRRAAHARAHRRSVITTGVVAAVASVALLGTLTACDDDGPPPYGTLGTVRPTEDGESPVITDPEGVVNQLEDESEFEEQYGQFDPGG